MVAQILADVGVEEFVEERSRPRRHAADPDEATPPNPYGVASLARVMHNSA